MEELVRGSRQLTSSDKGPVTHLLGFKAAQPVSQVRGDWGPSPASASQGVLGAQDICSASLDPENQTSMSELEGSGSSLAQTPHVTQGAVRQEGAQEESERSLPASVTVSQEPGFQFLLTGYFPLLVLTNG